MNTPLVPSRGLRALFTLAALAAALTVGQLRAAEPRTVPGLGVTLVPIPAGTFTMGRPGAQRFDGPQTSVTISKPFWLGQTEVTQRQWRTLMRTDVAEQVRRQLAQDTVTKKAGLPVRQRDGADRADVSDLRELVYNTAEDAPMYWVSWEEAVEFCRRLTERERTAGRLPAGYEYRLPTEAEWEYAARSGTTTATYAGDLEIKGGNHAPVLDPIAWYAGNSSESTAAPHVVAAKRPNGWGLYDMLGNVAEWVWDLSSDRLPGGSVRDPTGPRADSSTHIAASLAVNAPPGTARVFRGGAWSYRPAIVFAAMRMANMANLRERGLGFRVALAPEISR
jgi:formylglycine-generating enzyme required for sulfatase activity